MLYVHYTCICTQLDPKFRDTLATNCMRVGLRECALFPVLGFGAGASDNDDHCFTSFFLVSRASVVILRVTTFE